MAYGYSSDQAMTLSMPMPAGTPFTLLSAWSPATFASSGVRGGDGNYYFITVGPPSTLWQMDPGTGAVTLIGPINGLGSETADGIAYNSVNDTYYLAAGDFTVTNNLYSFDIYTLTATFVTAFPNATGR